MCVCVCVCVCVPVRMLAFMCGGMYESVYVSMYLCVYVKRSVCLSVSLSVCVCVSMYVCMCIRMFTHIHTHAQGGEVIGRRKECNGSILSGEDSPWHQGHAALVWEFRRGSAEFFQCLR